MEGRLEPLHVVMGTRVRTGPAPALSGWTTLKSQFYVVEDSSPLCA